ncbi:MAG: hypothetical protein IJJ59_09510 [Pseudobutyrivibrio sp.]|uniref:hypothetical protein n=1 Tax=Pseudobutyrivibrio sp. TaxID=2014367 RepID=UPI0025E762ED|nr:hypothetical protein [Pseudobutyrivibrio sp.]MBQ6463546.1 hypothetical protein [Pseudobutyrivibrio sp.]
MTDKKRINVEDDNAGDVIIKYHVCIGRNAMQLGSIKDILIGDGYIAGAASFF